MTIYRNGFILCASFLLAFAVLLFNHDPLNVDGILYLEVSKVFLQQGFHAAMAIYAWPFYSVLIGILHTFLHTSLFTTAFWLNNLFITLLIIFLIGILHRCEIPLPVIRCAIILLCIYPELNHLRAFIIRDAGYWALLFAAFYSLLSFWQTTKWRHAIAWNICIATATLFRIEGFIIWTLLPLTLFFHPAYKWRTRISQWLQTNLLLLLVVFLFIGWKLLYPHHTLNRLGRIEDVWQYISHILPTIKHLLSFSLWQQFIIDFIDTFSIGFSLLLIYALAYRLLPRHLPWRFIGTFVILNFAIPLFFYSYSNILAHRYLMPLCFILSLIPAFALNHLYQKIHALSSPFYFQKIFFMLIILGLFIQSLSGIVPFGYSKAYIVESGKWLATHTPSQSTIYSNSREVLFYANRPTLSWQQQAESGKILLPLQNGEWKHYRYLAIRVNYNSPTQLTALINALPLHPIKIFSNKRHDKVLIFYVTQ